MYSAAFSGAINAWRKAWGSLVTKGVCTLDPYQCRKSILTVYKSCYIDVDVLWTYGWMISAHRSCSMGQWPSILYHLGGGHSGDGWLTFAQPSTPHSIWETSCSHLILTGQTGSEWSLEGWGQWGQVVYLSALFIILDLHFKIISDADDMVNHGDRCFNLFYHICSMSNLWTKSIHK